MTEARKSNLEAIKKLEKALHDRLEAQIEGEISPAAFAQAAGVECDEKQVIAFLNAAVSEGKITRRTHFVCHNQTCRRPLSDEEATAIECLHCHINFDETERPSKKQIFYYVEGYADHSITWMIVVHGMNTTGAWQEELSWRIANKLKYQAPVLIYKYGWMTWQVLFDSRHKALSDRLGLRIRDAIKFAQQHGIIDPPHVIAHSFGTRLFSMILQNKNFADLKFGRVITIGSIIRPDFPWTGIIEQGQVQAVMNHYATQDGPVRFAHITIPNTGPSGRIGFSDAQVMNIKDDTYGHSSYFDGRELTKNLARQGLWDKFLTAPNEVLKSSGTEAAIKWRPSLPLWRISIRSLLLLLVGAVVAYEIWAVIDTGLQAWEFINKL